jgi:hypothetical protein
MYTVSFGAIFLSSFKHFPKQDMALIQNFIEHYEEFGFNGLPGRVKNSDNVDYDDPMFLTKVKYAQDNLLWHYHIGVPEYDKSNGHGDWTSEYVLHYQQIDSFVIKIVDLDRHPPFRLPEDKYFT